MPDHIFRENRKRRRPGSFLTLRVILGLLTLSGVMAGAFYLEFGSVGDSLCEGDCESPYSPSIWILAGGLTLAAVIMIAALIGTLLATVRRNKPSTLDTFMPPASNTDEP